MANKMNTLENISELLLDRDFTVNNVDYLDFKEHQPSDIKKALEAAFEAGERAGKHEAFKDQQPSTHKCMMESLNWLVNNDPNGLWIEYLTNFPEACHEHGYLSHSEITLARLEQQENGY